MNKTDSAFSAIQALFSLFFISVVAIALQGIIFVSRGSVEREKSKINHRDNLISIAENIKNELLNDESPDSDSLVDSFWRQNGESGGITIKIEDLSSKMNSNFFPKEIILETDLINKIELLDSYEQIDKYIEENGLIYSSNEVSSIISPEVYEPWFSPFGIANINFSSQIGLEKLSADLVGSNENVFLFLQRRNNLLKNKQLIQTETDFQFLTGVLYEKFSSIVTLQPQMNIHFIDKNVLEALVSYRPYNIEGWRSKADRLLEMREHQEITRDRLIEILEINNSYPLFYALGTKTWFWKIEVSDDKYVYQEILFVEPKEVVLEEKVYFIINRKLYRKE